MSTAVAIKEIDGKRAIELLEECVAERGEGYVYPRGANGRCDYVRDGQPSCMIGLAWVKHGYPVEQIAPLIGSPKWLCLGEDGDGLSKDIVQGDPQCPAMDADAIEIFGVAQVRQDLGETWGNALEAAKVTASGLGVL